jgi:predicted membrane protein
LLVLPVLSFASAVHHSNSEVAPLLAWTLGAWGRRTAVILTILVGIAGWIVGTPRPALEGITLAVFVTWLPAFFTCSPHYVQNVMAALLLGWMTAYLVMFFRLFRINQREWRKFSFLELLSDLLRSIHQKTNDAA